MNTSTAGTLTLKRTKPKSDNPLQESGLPLFFQIDNPDEIGIEAPENRIGLAVRTYVRSLTLMQKEAFVVSQTSGLAWRLCSDEGPYLNGHDYAPCPLAFLTTGMVCAYMNEILALAEQRKIKIDDIKLIQDNYYTMEGSLPRGTMTGGALPIDLEVKIDCDADEATVNRLISDAVAASPLNGLMRKQLESLFTLTFNEREISLGKARRVEGDIIQDLGTHYGLAKPVAAAAHTEPLVKKLDQVETQQGIAGGASSSLKSSQSRQLHIRGTCTLREDGVKEVVQELFNPLGSTFRFYCDEAPQHGGQGLAPDAVSYISAGIGFCYMTQIGRYVAILKKHLESYRVVQDSHFTLGGATGGTGVVGEADPIETHVFLSSNEDEEFARNALDMGEQTCFLHAFCKTEMKTKIKISRAP